MSKTSQITIAIISVLIIGIGVISGFLVSGDRIRSNVYIGNINVSGLTKTEAVDRLMSNLDSKIESLKLDLKFRDSIWELDLEDVGYKYDIDKAIEEAYSIGRMSNYFIRLYDVIKSKFNNQSFELDFSYEEEMLKVYLENLSNEINQQKVNASISFNKPDFVFTDEKEGRKLDEERTLQIIKEKISKNETSVTELPVTIIQADVKRSDIDKISEVIGKFSTSFNAADVNRTHNLKVATNNASDILLFPNEVYSVNQIIGPRLEEFGFREAKVIVNNQLVPGIGGGICQVSTTLYNAALLSNLSIIERRNHSLPSSYVSLGRDATISGDVIDLKFINSTDYPIYIYGEVVGNWVKFYVYGKKNEKNIQVRIQTETLNVTEPTVEIVEDPTLPEGTEVEERKAHTGYVVKSYKLLYEDGRFVSREILFTDRYRVVNGIKRIGTMKINTYDNISEQTNEGLLNEINDSNENELEGNY